MDIQALLEKLQKLDELKLQELVELHASLKEAFNKVRAGEIEGVEADDIAVLKDLANAAQKANDRAVELQVSQADVDAEIEKLSEAFKAEDGDPNEGDDNESDGDGEETPGETQEPQPGVQQPGEPNPQGEGQPDEEKEDDSEEVVVEKEIKVPSLAALNLAAKKQQARVTVKQSTASRELDRSMAKLRFTSVDGREIDGRELAEMMIARVNQFGNSPTVNDEKVTVATVKLDIPDDRWLKKDVDPDANSNKVDQIVAAGEDPDAWDDAIVASGGWCAPLEARYDIETIAGAHRPVRDGLPGFGADRGGIRQRRGIPITSGAGAIGSWTNTNDITPSNPATKPVLTITCDTIFETVLRAVTQRVRAGNFRQRADAEGVQAWLRVVQASHARRAESLLLDEIDAVSPNLTTSQQLGAARDILVSFTYLREGIISRQRMDPNSRIRVMAPSWLPGMIAADLTRGLQSDPAFFEITPQRIANWLSLRGINISWYADELTGAGGVGEPHQIFAPQAAGAVNDFPSHVTWFAWPEGSWEFLNGGQLDLGVVRDSTLNSTNDFEFFAETFEAAAFRGVESWKVNSNVCVNGESSGGTDQSALCNS